MEKINAFIKKFSHAPHSKLVLISSGGTIVPLEKHSVHYIENFSLGHRGAASAEYFLENGYGVIFFHRKGSLEPFTRRLKFNQFADFFDFEKDTVIVKGSSQNLVRNIVQNGSKYASSLLKVPFETLDEYIELLEFLSKCLSTLQSNAMFYLAAAVSDFYIPQKELPQHKLQSSDGTLTLTLKAAPKVIYDLVNSWVPNAFVVTFKLETDPNLLFVKAQKALSQYHHQLVIANLLQTRKQEVWFVKSLEDAGDHLELSESDLANGVEIEKHIVEKLVSLHQHFMNSNTTEL